MERVELIESNLVKVERCKKIHMASVDRITNGLFHYFFWNPSKKSKTVKLPSTSKDFKVAFYAVATSSLYNFSVKPVWYSRKRCKICRNVV